MKFSPPRKNRPLYAVCIPLLITAFVLFALGDFLAWGSLIQAAGGICLVFFIFLNLRFALSVYRYEIDGSSLIVFRRQGRREEKLCDIELSSALSLKTREEFLKDRPEYELCYNFCQNFASKERSYFLFTFNDREKKRALVIFEPDEAMKAEIRNYLR